MANNQRNVALPSPYYDDPCRDCSCTVPVIMKSLEIGFGIVVCFLTGLYCRYAICTINWISYNEMYWHTFVITIGILAVVTTFGFLCLHSCCSHAYELWRAFEVIIMGLFGVLYFISAVIELVYAAEYNYNYFSEQWAAASAFCFLLCVLYVCDTVYLGMFSHKLAEQTARNRERNERPNQYETTERPISQHQQPLTQMPPPNAYRHQQSL